MHKLHSLDEFCDFLNRFYVFSVIGFRNTVLHVLADKIVYVCIILKSAHTGHPENFGIRFFYLTHLLQELRRVLVYYLQVLLLLAAHPLQNC